MSLTGPIRLWSTHKITFYCPWYLLHKWEIQNPDFCGIWIFLEITYFWNRFLSFGYYLNGWYNSKFKLMVITVDKNQKHQCNISNSGQKPQWLHSNIHKLLRNPYVPQKLICVLAHQINYRFTAGRSDNCSFFKWLDFLFDIQSAGFWQCEWMRYNGTT